MSLLGGAVLGFWHNLAPGADAEFTAWHTREHVPERVGVPGFLRGRRYVAVAGAPRYFNLYETESLATLSGPDYVARLNDPTPWTRRVLPLFRDSKRTACRVVASRSVGIAGFMATLDLGPAAGRDLDLRTWLTTTALPGVAEQPGVTGAHLCEADVAATQVKTEEKALRDRPDTLARWVILVEAIDAESAAETCADLLGPEVLAAHGAAADDARAVYRLQYCLARAER
jgi:hypothetical protein